MTLRPAIKCSDLRASNKIRASPVSGISESGINGPAFLENCVIQRELYANNPLVLFSSNDVCGGGKSIKT